MDSATEKIVFSASQGRATLLARNARAWIPPEPYPAFFFMGTQALQKDNEINQHQGREQEVWRDHFNSDCGEAAA
jgi:hypothetical protein